jgi:ATP synthase protein I
MSVPTEKHYGVAVDMSSSGKQVATPPADGTGRNRGSTEQEGRARALGLSIGWNVVSYLIAGMIAYGAIGWLIGRAVHAAIVFPLGMLLGLGISIGYVIHHYGRADLETPKGADRDR